ncbi:hypothetical protein [Lacrimispora algidixylanolytica]|uniref:Uncharacterized protein n=1 Tax=Lacrimispora algidixylanolytica TaxID=94868 RepID=A0A419T4U4_9FIRM|nr:hypothetical protein [Lacrimispora algidixylanolytica]RKD32408.1 hypothetical protein BET01_03445 [Lacrimispora algidixylanolytica]
MIIEKELLALSDVAKFCGTSNSNVSNWRNRDSKFPAPYTETSAGPIWKAEDIVTYLQKKFDDEYDVISTGNMSSKRIAIIGRARGGKSFFNSRFVFDRTGFVNLFCGNNSDKTACPIYVKISEYITLENYIFHTDFNSIYQSDDGDDELRELKERVSTLVDHTYLQDDIEKMNEIERVIREIRTVEEGHPNRKNSNTYIDTFQRPSVFCKEILRECGLGSVEIVDTPGVSGNIEANKIAKSDIYLFLVKPDNGDESQTLRKVVTEIKADVATSKVVFLYKKEGVFITKKKYEDARLAIRKDMAAYSELFKDLKGNIISTGLDVLDPSSHCILFPTMDPDEIILPEELFLEDIKEKFLEAFKPEDESGIDKELKKIVSELGGQAEEFTLNIMRNIPAHELAVGEMDYSVEQVMAEQHDRVMTKDNYRFHNDLDYAYSMESSNLDNYFSSFTAAEYPEEWQQIIIKYVHKKLTASIRADRGLGVGAHPWEERPARTMLIEESILADRILANILDKDERYRNEPYRKALRDSNITSATWNCVGCINDVDAITKLKIVKECLINVRVSSRQEMVLCRYVGGLRKIAEYKILGNMGYTEDKCMEELKKIPF